MTPTLSDKGSSAVETGEGLGSSAARIPTAQTADVTGQSDSLMRAIQRTERAARSHRCRNGFSQASSDILMICKAAKGACQ